MFELSLGSGKGVARHTHTREEESYYVLAGELEVKVGETTFVLKAGDSLLAPRNIPHELRNPRQDGQSLSQRVLAFRIRRVPPRDFSSCAGRRGCSF